MYRCQICHQCSKVRQPMRRHILYRTLPSRIVSRRVLDPSGRFPRRMDVEEQPRQEIAREIAVCTDCEQKLKNGTPLAQLQQQYQTAVERNGTALLNEIAERGKPLGFEIPLE